MKISSQWLRDFVDLKVDPKRLADDLTLAGIAVESIIGESHNAVFEMDITTNRPDAMNHYGVARECSAIYNLPLKPIEPALPLETESDKDFEIEIEDKEGCARYTAGVIRGVTIKDSPEAVKKRLRSVDQRPINNAADASNYTLWEMGHPTHAFDLDLLEGRKIIVRRARAGETLKTLDGADRKLSAEDLIIADGKKPVALAGVMGGFDTMITSKTKNILIESAWFDPSTIRKSSKRHGLHTDASHRFERGADYGATALAGARVAQRILESSGGELYGNQIDVIGRPIDQAPVSLRTAEVRRILGDEIHTSEIVRILNSLGFDAIPEPGEEADFTVQLPSWRLDVEREIDLIEEIARLHGYDKFPNTLPSFSGAVTELPTAKKDRKLRSTLLALGYHEAISQTFISHEDAAAFSQRPVIELENPLSEEASVMRTSLVPGMLNMLGYNLNRGNENIQLFEIGNVFGAEGEESLETKQVCMGATGNAIIPGVNQTSRAFSFFDLKGDAETLLSAFEHQKVTYDDKAADYYRRGHAARVLMNGKLVAQFGEIDSEIARNRKLRQQVFVGEVYLDVLYGHELQEPRYQGLPRYPAVARDFSFIFDDSVKFDQIETVAEGLGLREMRSLEPIEIFRGGSIAAGKYSVLLRVKFQATDRTLREDEVAGWARKIVEALEKLGGRQRGVE